MEKYSMQKITIVGAGRVGVEKVIELPLNNAEKKMFDETIKNIKNDLKQL